MLKDPNWIGTLPHVESPVLLRIPDQWYPFRPPLPLPSLLAPDPPFPSSPVLLHPLWPARSVLVYVLSSHSLLRAIHLGMEYSVAP